MDGVSVPAFSVELCLCVLRRKAGHLGPDALQPAWPGRAPELRLGLHAVQQGCANGGKPRHQGVGLDHHDLPLEPREQPEEQLVVVHNGLLDPSPTPSNSPCPDLLALPVHGTY